MHAKTLFLMDDRNSMSVTMETEKAFLVCRDDAFSSPQIFMWT